MRRTAGTFLALLAAFLALPMAHAQSCPAGCISAKPPDCATRIAKAKAAGCLPESNDRSERTLPAPCPTPCPAAPITVNCPECKPVVQEKYIIQEAPPAAAKGAWLVGAGPIWLNDWGAAAVAGYSWGNGWQLQGGPVWIPQHGTNVTGSCPCYGGGGPGNHGGDDPPGGGTCPCPSTFYAPPKQEWGGQLTAIYVFK